MDRRRFLMTSLAGALATPLAAEAQQAAKGPARVGVLYPGPKPLGPLEAFRHGLVEFGYVEGQNLTIDWRFADGRNEQLPQLAS
jgi:putative tryptophan/tyrosine transport system substrate-binding protein